MRTTALLLAAAAIALLAAPAPADTKSIKDATSELQRIDGFFPLYWDEGKGRLLLEVPRLDEEFLYQVSLSTGVGSNPVGLDRGQPGRTHVVRFERSGPKLLLVQLNYAFQAIGAGPAERRAVEESFARSAIFGFTIEAEQDGRLLVDATAFFVRDAHGVGARLRDTEQGRYTLDASRSAPYLPRTKGFPDNTEVEVTVTLVAEGPAGRLLVDTVPTPESVTVRQRHSLVRLPPAGYTPRRMDPRVGYYPITVYDYASPISVPLERRWIARHRLQKKDPAAAVSEPVEPIVYYVDPGTPEPVRSALVEGASWWNAAFEAAGFRNAFQVRLLPPDADPMDVRYNVINWVHRSTRGWAYGSSIVDPRTGEIIRGVVTLDSQRARQDFLIFTALDPSFAATCEAGAAPEVEALASTAAEKSEVALARIRQLSAHEVGHTLGLAHNFAASTYGRASVMDYPAPLVEISNGRLDFSDAYARGIGAYDRFAIRYGYAQFGAGVDAEAELDRIAREGAEGGMLFLSDDDARPAGAAHPLASLWDNGPDPVANLRHEMAVRRSGLDRFGVGNLPERAPLSLLEARLAPLLLHHRYQLAAAAKTIGGVVYTHALRGGTANKYPAIEPVPPARQREALEAVLDTLEPSEVAVPERILALVPPPAFGYETGTAELFERRTAPVFDPIAAAIVTADLAVRALLEPNRAARLEVFHARDAASPGFREVLDSLVTRTWRQPPPQSGYLAAVARAEQTLVVTRIIELATNGTVDPHVRALAVEALRSLVAELRARPGTGANAAHRRATRDEIERFLERPDAPRTRTPPPSAPPGDPIGGR